jgi:hypothetical protein
MGVDGRWTGRRKGKWDAGRENPQLGGEELLFACVELRDGEDRVEEAETRGLEGE